MKEVIKINNYSNIMSMDFRKNIVSKLNLGDTVILDFKGVMDIDFVILETLIVKILDSTGYNSVKTRLVFKNATLGIKESLRYIINEYLKI